MVARRRGEIALAVIDLTSVEQNRVPPARFAPVSKTGRDSGGPAGLATLSLLGFVSESDTARILKD